ncbi:hypothetical protein PFISCL1PPCAC_11187, partial [Pristionchus fissidentatus]
LRSSSIALCKLSLRCIFIESSLRGRLPSCSHSETNFSHSATVGTDPVGVVAMTRATASCAFFLVASIVLCKR